MIDIALRQGEVDQIQLWRRSFSEAVSDPTIIVGSAWAQIFSHDQKQAAALLTELRALSAGLSDETARRRTKWWCDPRSEGRRVGTECVSACKSRWSHDP